MQSGYIHPHPAAQRQEILTTVQGVNPKINKKVILKECKKKFNCNGTIVMTPSSAASFSSKATRGNSSRSS